MRKPRIRSIIVFFVAAAALFVAALLLLEEPDVAGKAKQQRVHADFHTIGEALRAYRRDHGHYPTEAQGFRILETPEEQAPSPNWTKLLKVIPWDPWGGEYRYRILRQEDPRGFELRSSGKDRRWGTKDDLSSLDH